MIADALLLLVVGIGTQAQSPVIHVTSTAKRPRKYLYLLRRRVKSVLVCSFLVHALDGNTRCLECQTFAPFICQLKQTVLWRFSIEQASQYCLPGGRFLRRSPQGIRNRISIRAAIPSVPPTTRKTIPSAFRSELIVEPGVPPLVGEGWAVGV